MSTTQTLAFSDHGSGSPLVLLHAFPFDRRFWDGVTPALVAAGFRVIAPDFLGFGQSQSREPWSIEDQAKAVSASLDSLGITSAAVAGLSMGGYVALAMAALRPSQLSALVLANTKASPDSPTARQARADAAVVVSSKGVSAFCDGMVDKLLAPGSPQDVRNTTRALMNQPQQTVLYALDALRDRPDRRLGLEAITAPTLVVCGSLDPICPPQEGRELAGSIAGAAYVEIEGAAHLTNIEAPQAFAQAVTNFLPR